MRNGALHAAIRRWHFYAGLFVLPFVLVLSVTGSIYLFKPQIDRWEERAYRDPGATGPAAPDRQLAAATTAYPGAHFNHYRLPERPGDAAMIQLGLPEGRMREVYLSPEGRVLGALDPAKRISETVARIHGSLLLGRYGDWLVELAASWTIVMILTGLYLWVPRPFRGAGTLWPRLYLRGRPLLRDVHGVTGFWIAGLVLVMLASGLPWAGAWGSAFAWSRAELGLVRGPQDWKIGADGGHPAHHGAMAMAGPPPAPPAGLPLSAFVARAAAERMAFPVLVLPPHAPQRFGPPTGAVWTVESEAQDRPLDRRVTYDAVTGRETGRAGFADQHVIDRIVNTGVAWHEGALFGLANQIIGALTALALITVSVAGVLMWLKRRPRGKLGAPMTPGPVRTRGLVAAVVVLGLLLPLFGASVLALAALDVLMVTVRRGGRRAERS